MQILQQILTLKYVGFSLEEIKALQPIQPVDLEESLQMQKKLLEEKREKLDQVKIAFPHAIYGNRGNIYSESASRIYEASGLGEWSSRHVNIFERLIC
ncbi:MerR family DNA-binding protein [Brevibacillus halotolerans]|uniref:MerR family DNA-binding protein n=1 Tax=Brevibacillus halotolerans TaxID=1507437 RepID=UPI003D166EDF